MKSMQIDRKETGVFSEQQLKLVYDQEYFREFIQQPMDKQAVEAQISIKRKTFSEEQRKRLHTQLHRQYEHTGLGAETKSNIDALLNENTFTITTGHQLSLFTGPLYFVVKILHVIKMCNELNAEHPGNHFVPVYWMASEDHDFEEIQSCSLFNQTVTWETDQEGPVGKFDLDGFQEVKAKLKALFSNHIGSEVHEAIDSYKGRNFAEATRNLVNYLFSAYGLVIIDGDDPELKKALLPVVQREIDTQFSFEAVTETSDRLGTKIQKLQVTPREINLFCYDKGIRNRLIEEEGRILLEGVGSFTRKELGEALETGSVDMVKFSPNVVLRPLYQEMILPNLLYVGGAGEISYWLQLKGVFDAMEVPYPLIQIRNSVMWIDKGLSSKMEKFGFEVKDVFRDTEQWKKEYVSEHDSEELNFDEIDAQLEGLNASLRKMILTIDASKEQMVNAELTRLEKQVEGIKAKAVKLSKANHDQAMKTIDQIRTKLFPGNGLQERSVNFFQFCADGEVFTHLSDLYKALQPFGKDLTVIIEE